MNPDLNTKLDEILAACREGLALAEKATPGPWKESREKITRGLSSGKEKLRYLTAPPPQKIVLHPSYCDGDPWQAWIEGRDDDIAFIARARTLCPQALRSTIVAIEALRDANARLGKYAEDSCFTDALQRIDDDWNGTVFGDPDDACAGGSCT